MSALQSVEDPSGGVGGLQAKVSEFGIFHESLYPRHRNIDTSGCQSAAHMAMMDINLFQSELCILYRLIAASVAFRLPTTAKHIIGVIA
jgi:hypothetical protein